MQEFEEEEAPKFEDDVTITPGDLDADVSEDGFTIKGKVFFVNTNTMFYNDEDVPMSFDVQSEDGDPVSFGFDTQGFPDTPTLAEALVALFDEGELDKALFTKAELKEIYASAIRRIEQIRMREHGILQQVIDQGSRYAEIIEGLGPTDFAEELRAKYAGG